MDLLRHLRYFVAVAEELHFGRAADRLHIAQSPLSRRIRALERELGADLFVRTTRQVRLTPAGRALLDESRAVLGRVDELRTTMSAARDVASTTVRAGVSADVPAAVLASVVARLEREHADVRLVPVETPGPEQLAALVEHRTDLGLLPWPAPVALRHGPALARPLGVLVPAEDPLAASDHVELGAIGGARPVVLPPRASAPDRHDALLRTCHAHGWAPREVLSAEGPDFAAGLVLTRGAVALLEAGSAAPDGTTWRPVAGDPLTTTVVVAWRPDDRRPTVALAADLLRDALLGSGRWTGAPSTAPVGTAPRPADAF